MARKKKFNGQAGFLWNKQDIQRVEEIATGKDLTPSDIYRQAMQIYFAIQDGSAQLIYKPLPAPETSTPVAEAQPTGLPEKVEPTPNPT